MMKPITRSSSIRGRAPIALLIALSGCAPEAAEAPPPEWQPDTATLLFTTHRNGRGDVVLGRADSILATLTTDPAFDGFARWSPDGSRIAFDSDRAGEGNRDIYVMDADGSDVVRLTEHPGFDFVPAWSPDGEWIAFVSTRDSDFLPSRRNFEKFRGEIYRIRPDGSDLTRLTHDPAHDQAPAWHADGRIAFCRQFPDGRGDLWTVDQSGANERVFHDGPDFDCSPAWSPTGDRIVWRTTRGDSAVLILADANGGGAHTLETGLRLAYEPAWSPDGRWVCFTGGASDDSLDIWAVRIDGSDRRRVTTHPARDQACSWPPVR